MFVKVQIKVDNAFASKAMLDWNYSRALTLYFLWKHRCNKQKSYCHVSTN